MQLAEKNGDTRTETVHCQIGTHHFRITETSACDQEEMLRLFSSVFGHSADPDWYAWKYDCGRGQAIGLWSDDGHLAAHYAGFPRELRWRGTPVQAIQIGDVMVTPEVRGLLTRKGPFFQVCSRFFADRVGLGKSYQLAFGFPNDRHMRLGAALDIYHDAGIIQQISWPVRRWKLPIGWRWTPLAKEKNPTWQLEHAWQSMSKDFTDYVLGVRDADYLNYRFLNRPDRKYQIFCLRRWPWENVVAVAVMYVEQGRAELLDVIGARAAFSMVVRATTTEAARAGAMALTAWASPAALAVFEESGVEIMGKAANLAVARASALTDSEVKEARWWWMGGDTDFL